MTSAAGIHFHHNNGAYGDKLLPETMGGGVAFFDFDNDGAPDLLFVNSTYWPWRVPEGKKPTSAALYHNDGKGHFTNATVGSGLEVSFYGMGVAVVMEARHLCMEMRGAKSQNSPTITSAMVGVFHQDHRTREEFLGFINGSRK